MDAVALQSRIKSCHFPFQAASAFGPARTKDKAMATFNCGIEDTPLFGGDGETETIIDQSPGGGQ